MVWAQKTLNHRTCKMTETDKLKALISGILITNQELNIKELTDLLVSDLINCNFVNDKIVEESNQKMQEQQYYEEQAAYEEQYIDRMRDIND